MINFPTKVEKVIAKILSNTNDNKWVESAIKLSTKYRLNRLEPNRHEVFIDGVDDVLGYLALRAPSTYAQLSGAMSNVAELLPAWKPLSVLDIGSGPGTGVWAACEIWPSINEVICLERDSNFCRIGKEITQSSFPDLVKMEWKLVDLSVTKPELNIQFDLVTIGSVLNEMESEQRSDILEFAYKHCKGVLLVVEPGTPYGFDAITQSSTLLRSHQGRLLAPYIDSSLPTTDHEPIGFAQKIVRPEFNRQIRQVQRKIDNKGNKRLLPASDWEEAKYGYVALSVIPPEIVASARLLANPKISKSYIELKILTKNGIETKRIFKKNKFSYKLAKKLKWGELISDSLG